MNYNNLTIFFVSYYSKKTIQKLLKKINKKIKVLVVDNANEKNLKKELEQKFKNVKVIKSRKNLGQTGGINVGFKNIKTKYSLYMDSDINFKPNTIDQFLRYANIVKDFLILGPQHEKSKYKESFLSKTKSKHKDLIRMKLIHGHFLFFNMQNVKKVGLYDQNIFLYYDETDFCLRAYRKGQKIYVIPKIQVFHKGGSSVNINDKIEIEINKHWHFMWSKFYYFKKNYSYFFAIKKTFHDLFIISFKYTIFFFIDRRKKLIYFNQLCGLINSYLGKKSYKRLNLK
jgi:N-acetylglucosaminyl-diphospho-decaprenol L-rhamnosyltransferase